MAREPLPPAYLMRMALRVAKIRGRSKLQHALVLADAMDEAGWQSASIPTGRRGRERYRVIALDVWGNARDGYEINNRYRTTTAISVPTEELLHNVRWYRDALRNSKLHPNLPTGRSLWSNYAHVPGAFRRALRRYGVIGALQIEDLDGLIAVSSRRGRPILHLEREA